MSILGTNLGASLAGAGQAERVEAREKDKGIKPKAQATRREDEFVTVSVESADAVRSLKSNDQEEAHEDRRGKQQAMRGPPASDRPRIDVRG